MSSNAIGGNVPHPSLTLTDLKIGRMKVGRVDIVGKDASDQFQELLEMAAVAMKRERRDARATRYLPALTNSEQARLLSVEVADYLADMKRRRLRSATIEKNDHHFRLLRVATGDIPVDQIQPRHIQKFWDVLRWWPSQVGSNRIYLGKTDEEIFRMGEASNRKPRADATVDVAISMMSTFFNHLVRRGVISLSPMASFSAPKRSLVKKKKARAEFSAEELATIFDYAIFVPWAKKAPHLWWGPMIGLYTGARVSEVAQLKVSDVVFDCGVWCFQIQVTEDEDGVVRQEAKGESSLRTVPIAQPLLDAGFLDFLEDAKAGGHPRLFPQLRRGKSKSTGEDNGTSYGAALGRVFSQQLKRIMPIEKGRAFHCFRHTLITQLRIARVPLEDIASITGHSDGDGLPAPLQFKTMQSHYIHMPDEVVRATQVQTLAIFDPNVALPKYVRGQFAHCFGPHAKQYV